VERLPDPEDRRIINIAITKQGKKHLKQLVSLYKKDLKVLLSNLEKNDLEVLCRSFENLQSILGKIP
jgi:DNA-binding MarR family transcriptional regulator